MNAASAIHLSIFGLTPIVLHGTEELKRRYLPRVVSGELHVAFAVTEPDAGNDITHIKTFARREGDNYVINGRKVFTTKAHEANKMLLLTRTTPFEQVTKKTDGMSLFFADLDRDAVEVRELHKLGRHAVDTNMLFIDNLKVSASDLIGEEGTRLSLPARRTQPRAHPDRRGSDRNRTRRGRQGRALRQGARSCSDARSDRTRPSRIRSPTPTPSSKRPS